MPRDQSRRIQDNAKAPKAAGVRAGRPARPKHTCSHRCMRAMARGGFKARVCACARSCRMRALMLRRAGAHNRAILHAHLHAHTHEAQMRQAQKPCTNRASSHTPCPGAQCTNIGGRHARPKAWFKSGDQRRSAQTRGPSPHASNADMRA